MCDNSVIVSALNSKSVKGEAIHPLQPIFLTAALKDIELFSEWLSIKENWIADALSRFQINKVANLFPQFQDPSFQLHRETGKPISDLQTKAANLLWHALAPRTRAGYFVAVNKFKQFATQSGVNPFPASLLLLSNWYADTVTKTSTTIAQNYLSAVRNHHVDLGLPTAIFDDERLKRIIRGAKRQYATSSIRDRKEITKEILMSMMTHLHNTHDDINIRAALCTTFAAFLRIDEFTWDN
jgi:hypothetical protein